MQAMSDDGDNPLRGGASIPGYEIESELGRGGFAVVYRSHQPKLRRTVALKVLTNVDPADDDAKRRFEAECQAIGSLSWHPHVVTVYDAGATEDGLPFLAMEHLPSGSLQAKLADHGPAPVEEVLRIAVQMCDALGAAHKAGILHRDIKPANVLTSRIGDYKLADFGIARFGDSQRTATGVITGTVAYTAPEVLRGARASSSSDLYALGAMLCAVASGRTPFVRDVDESVVAIMYRVNTDDPPSLAEFSVPDDVTLLIHTLMDKDPDKRPASALEAAQWAQHLQERRGIAAVPLHSDPDLLPELPPAAVAAGAASVGPPAAPATPSPAPPPAYDQGTPAPPTVYGGTPAPPPAYGGTPAPPPATGAPRSAAGIRGHPRSAAGVRRHPGPASRLRPVQPVLGGRPGVGRLVACGRPRCSLRCVPGSHRLRAGRLRVRLEWGQGRGPGGGGRGDRGGPHHRPGLRRRRVVRRPRSERLRHRGPSSARLTSHGPDLPRAPTGGARGVHAAGLAGLRRSRPVRPGGGGRGLALGAGAQHRCARR